LNAIALTNADSLEDILSMDTQARKVAREFIQVLQK
jgi:hypothetical protein